MRDALYQQDGRECGEKTLHDDRILINQCVTWDGL
jgi:hypothetical protein